MNEDLQEAIGRALYESSFHFDDNDIPTWDELSEETWLKRSTWIKRAEKVVETYKKWIEQEKNSVITLTNTEAKLLVALLELASDQFSNHGCNDFELDKCIPDLEERCKLMKSYNDYNGSPEDFEYDIKHGGQFKIESDAGLMGYLVDRLKEQLETTST